MINFDKPSTFGKLCVPYCTSKTFTWKQDLTSLLDLTVLGES